MTERRTSAWKLERPHERDGRSVLLPSLVVVEKLIGRPRAEIVAQGSAEDGGREGQTNVQA